MQVLQLHPWHQTSLLRARTQKPLTVFSLGVVVVVGRVEMHYGQLHLCMLINLTGIGPALAGKAFQR